MSVIINNICGNFSSGVSSLLTNLIMYYKLDETTGTAVDDSTDIQNGTTNATVGTTGKLLYSESFDGSTDCLTIPYNVSQLINGTAVSVSFWTYFNTLPSIAGHEAYLARGLVSLSPYENVILKVGTDNLIYFHVKNTTNVDYEVNSSGVVTLSSWYNVVGVCTGSGSALKLYVNGSDVSTGAETFSGTINGNTNGWAFGDAYGGAGSGLVGRLDEIAIWNRALSGAEVTTLYNSGTGIQYPF